MLSVHLSDNLYLFVYFIRMRRFKILFCSLLVGLFWIFSFSYASDDVHYEQLYNECSSNYSSLLQYSNSLDDQLDSCLQSFSWLDYLMFNLQWYWDNWELYSLPVSNDLFLPDWYRAYVDSWVVMIWRNLSLENAYSISDDDFQEVMDSYWVVFLYLFGWALFLMFLFVIRKYFIWLKS